VGDTKLVERLSHGGPRLGLGAVAGREVRHLLDSDDIPRREEHLARREDGAAGAGDVLRMAVGEPQCPLGVDHAVPGIPLPLAGGPLLEAAGTPDLPLGHAPGHIVPCS
jgi:hypothetical protein